MPAYNLDKKRHVYIADFIDEENIIKRFLACCYMLYDYDNNMTVGFIRNSDPYYSEYSVCGTFGYDNEEKNIQLYSLRIETEEKIEFFMPEPNEKYEEYCLRLSDTIDEHGYALVPLLLGPLNYIYQLLSNTPKNEHVQIMRKVPTVLMVNRKLFHFSFENADSSETDYGYCYHHMLEQTAQWEHLCQS